MKDPDYLENIFESFVMEIFFTLFASIELGIK
jgi:hypothetical protein